ncbi:MAG: hypothetical protein IPL67_06290 [Ignavibacteria bacterium]|nr:hypothetical protein [Ignavibacteria bacterium]
MMEPGLTEEGQSATQWREKCGLSLKEKQQMLEMDTEQDRLDFISTYLENVLPKLKEAERISEIIKSDGYIQ